MTSALLGDVVALPHAEVASEAQYLAAWNEHVQPRAADGSFALALAGGYLADRLAWVFVAGYQAALRATFTGLPLPGWTALAVSEDRSKDDPLPGLTWQASDSGYWLDGHKTWIAAVQHVQHIIMRARGDQPGVFLMARDTPGLTLSVSPAPAMLRDLSQGKAHLHGVEVGASARLDTDLLSGFGRREALHIYIAFIGMCLRTVQANATDTSSCLQLLEQAEPLVNDCDEASFEAFSSEIQALRERVGKTLFADDAHWQRDQRLIAMYHRG
jgi:hypothetical protein